MIGSLPARPLLAAPGPAGRPRLGSIPPTARAQAPAAPEANPGQFFLIEEPIDSEVLERIKAVDQAADRPDRRPEDRPRRSWSSSSGPAGPSPAPAASAPRFELANFLSTELAGAKLTVAYVPQPLKGYAVLPALACDEIVMGPDASIGPITPEGPGGQGRLPRAGPASSPAGRGSEPDLFAGLLDRDADLKVVRTADRQVHYVLAENLAEFLKANQVAEDDIQPAWEGGQPGRPDRPAGPRGGVLQAHRRRPGRDRQRLPDRLPGPGRRPDPAPGAPAGLDPDRGPDRPDQGGVPPPADRPGPPRGGQPRLLPDQQPGRPEHARPTTWPRLIADIKDMKTVAYVDDRATGVSALIALACDDIVFRRGAQMGGVQQLITGGNGQVQDLTEGQIDSLTKRAEGLAAPEGAPRRRRPRDGRPRRPDRPGHRRQDRRPVPGPRSRRSMADPARYLNPVDRQGARARSWSSARARRRPSGWARRSRTSRSSRPSTASGARRSGSTARPGSTAWSRP